MLDYEWAEESAADPAMVKKSVDLREKSLSVAFENLLACVEGKVLEGEPLETDDDAASCVSAVHSSVGAKRSRAAGGGAKAAAARPAKRARGAATASASAAAKFAFAVFCDGLLQRFDAGDGTTAVKNFVRDAGLDCDRLAAYVVDGVLHAVGAAAGGDAPAMLPRCMELVHTHTGAVAAWSSCHERVPEWQFLRWLPQMTAYISDEPSGRAVVAGLARVAAKFPQAVYYPLRVNRMRFSVLPADTLQPLVRALAGVQERLNSFVRAVDNLVFVETRLHWCIRRVMAAPKDAPALFQEMVEDGGCLDTKSLVVGPRSKKALASPLLYGIRTKLQGVSRGAGFGDAFFKTTLDDVQKFIQDKLKEQHPPDKLSDLSPWLAKFQRSYGDHDIEVPGQFDRGARLSLVWLLAFAHSHTLAHSRATLAATTAPLSRVKIVNFDASVLVLRSMRRPLRLTVATSDERNVRFLVKGGEDMRLDQRIEQLFRVMNEILEADPKCASRELRLRTYSIVPATPSLGLVEWVDDTSPMKEVVMRAGLRPEERLPGCGATLAARALPCAPYAAWCAE